MIRKTGIRLSATLLVLVATSTLQGQKILIDDFEDGNLDGWTTIDFSAGQPWGPGLFDVSGGELRMAHTGSIPAPDGTPFSETALFALWDASTDPLYDNGYLRAKIRTDRPDNNVTIGLRADLTTFSAYLLEAETRTSPVPNPSAFRLLKIEGGTTSEIWESDSLLYFPGETWNVELGVVGNTLSIKKWRDGDPEPAMPDFVTQDANPLPGGLVLLTSDVGSPNPEFADNSFDDIVFIVPEPSALCLMMLGCVGLARRRR